MTRSDPARTGADADPAVHIVDDDAGIRAALESLFRSVGYATFTFASTAEFMASGRASAAGCLVLDVRLPGMNGLDFQDRLADVGSTMPVILMTGHGDIPMSVRGMKAGAVDFLPKPFREQDMLDAVSNAFVHDQERRAARAKSAGLEEKLATLSPRERQVLGRVAAGKMNKQIAFDLELSEITIKIHRGNAMRKLGARNLTDFIKIAGALNLTE